MGDFVSKSPQPDGGEQEATRTHGLPEVSDVVGGFRRIKTGPNSFRFVDMSCINNFVAREDDKVPIQSKDTKLQEQISKIEKMMKVNSAETEQLNKEISENVVNAEKIFKSMAGLRPLNTKEAFSEERRILENLKLNMGHLKLESEALRKNKVKADVEKVDEATKYFGSPEEELMHEKIQLELEKITVDYLFGLLTKVDEEIQTAERETNNCRQDLALLRLREKALRHKLSATENKSKDVQQINERHSESN